MTTVLRNYAKGVKPTQLSDPGDAGAIPVGGYMSAVCSMTSAGAETRTLAIPTAEGQELLLIADNQTAGDIVLTVASAVNATGNTVLTFGDNGDNIKLLGIDVAGTLRWTVAFNDGVALSTP